MIKWDVSVTLIFAWFRRHSHIAPYIYIYIYIISTHRDMHTHTHTHIYIYIYIYIYIRLFKICNIFMSVSTVLNVHRFLHDSWSSFDCCCKQSKYAEIHIKQNCCDLSLYLCNKFPDVKAKGGLHQKRNTIYDANLFT